LRKQKKKNLNEYTAQYWTQPKTTLKSTRTGRDIQVGPTNRIKRNAKGEVVAVMAKSGGWDPVEAPLAGGPENPPEPTGNVVSSMVANAPKRVGPVARIAHLSPKTRKRIGTTISPYLGLKLPPSPLEQAAQDAVNQVSSPVDQIPAAGRNKPSRGAKQFPRKHPKTSIGRRWSGVGPLSRLHTPIGRISSGVGPVDKTEFAATDKVPLKPSSSRQPEQTPPPATGVDLDIRPPRVPARTGTSPLSPMAARLAAREKISSKTGKSYGYDVPGVRPPAELRPAVQTGSRASGARAATVSQFARRRAERLASRGALPPSVSQADMAAPPGAKVVPSMVGDAPKPIYQRREPTDIKTMGPGDVAGARTVDWSQKRRDELTGTDKVPPGIRGHLRHGGGLPKGGPDQESELNRRMRPIEAGEAEHKRKIAAIRAQIVDYDSIDYKKKYADEYAAHQRRTFTLPDTPEGDIQRSTLGRQSRINRKLDLQDPHYRGVSRDFVAAPHRRSSDPRSWQGKSQRQLDIEKRHPELFPATVKDPNKDDGPQQADRGDKDRKRNQGYVK